MICSVCKQQRSTLTDKPSALIPTITLHYCNQCLEKGWEPRYIIILAARSLGERAVRDFIRNHKYDGADILASDVI